MRTEEEIQSALVNLEAQANAYKNVYNDSFVAIKALRWILDLPAPIDLRRRED